MKENVKNILKELFEKNDVKLEDSKILDLIEIPKDYDNGDFAFPCFILTKEMKKSPHEIAVKLRTDLELIPEEFEDIVVSGPYLNFFVNRKKLAENLINEIKTQKDLFGKNEHGIGKRIMIEFPSPNTNKPLHLGHLRNMAIGESVSKILEANGFEVIRVSLNNDRGTHICKSMLAYKKWGKGKTPEEKKKKSDHFVGDFYVKFAKEAKKKPKLEDEAQKMLMMWEIGNVEVRELWSQMRAWAIEGFEETYKKFGTKLDREYFESDIYKEGKDIIYEGLEKGIFERKEDGAVSINLEKEKLGEKILLRKDGTSIYITQDIYLAKRKFDDFDLEESIYVTGNEQDYHFAVLFSILDKLGIADRNKLKHLSYGMVNLPNGRMKSREGTVVDADDLIDELQKLVKKDLRKRYKLKKEELEDRSLKIALSALKYFLLKVDIKKNMTFNPEESISFDGDTGPYCEYSYARASSILKKSGDILEFTVPENLEKKETELILKLNEFKEVVKSASYSMNPSLLASYSYKLAQIFSEFYHECPVIGSKNEMFRLNLVNAFRQTLKNSLSLLGIEVVEEM